MFDYQKMKHLILYFHKINLLCCPSDQYYCVMTLMLLTGMDMSTCDATSLSKDRESLVMMQLCKLEDQFTMSQTFKVFAGSYNVNGQSPPNTMLLDWLAVDQEPPDLYVLGFQELDLSKEAFLFAESIKEDEWTAMVKASLHTEAKYSLVKSIRLIGMLLLVYTREEHVAHVSNISVDTVGTGIMGQLGNKGGVGISLRFHATDLCFVNSHLAAHPEFVDRRNQDYHSICSRMTFSQYEKLSRDCPIFGVKRIKDFDTVIWVGDLNYRLNDIDVNEVKEMLAEENIATILESDQFKHQQQQRKAFVEFQEGTITFRPTYKYDVGTDEWDSSEKNRAPAWCDRVLWKGDIVTQTAYRSHMTLLVNIH